MSEKNLHICHLYYDILNLYGDNGNIRTMEKRLAWRGIDSKVSRVTFGPVPDDNDYDIIFIGGGQDFEQELLVKDLFEYKAEWLKEQIEKGGFILAHWDGTTETEERIKEETKATIRCIPMVADEESLQPGKCVFSGKPSDCRVLFARAY